MSNNKVVRFLLYALAIWVALSIAGLVVSFVLRGVNQASQPSVSNIVNGLKSPQESERKAAIEKIQYPNWSDPAIVEAVSDLALIEENPYIKSRAIIYSLKGFSGYSGKTRAQLQSAQDKPILTLDKIDTISSMVLEETLDSHRDHNRNQVYDSLYTFLQNTVNAQQDPDVFVGHLTNLLRGLLASDPDRYQRGKITRILTTLNSYAASRVLPDDTLSVLLNTYQHQTLQRHQAPSMVIEILGHQSRKMEFRNDILETFERTAVEHENRSIRRNAIFALRQQAILTGRLSPALSQAMNDKDSNNAQAAIGGIVEFKAAQGEKTGRRTETLLAIAFDTTQDPRLRATALRNGVVRTGGNYAIEPEFIEAAEALRNDPEPLMRAAGLYFIRTMPGHELYRGRDSELINWLETALQDKDATVRGSALGVLEVYPADEAWISKNVVRGLQDEDPRVVQVALQMVRTKKLNTPELVEQVRKLTEHEDTAIHSSAKRQLVILETKNRNLYQNVKHILSDRKNYGGLLYLAAALLGIGIGSGFSLYYAYRFIQLALEKQLKAAVAFVALLVWGGASSALGAWFVLGLFGMGHNTPAPLAEQLKISTTLAGLVAGYAVLGFVMYWLIRKPKQKTV